MLKDGDPELLNDFARMIIAAPGSLKHRDLNLAVKLAQAANVGTKEQDPFLLDTYALALFATGKRDQAIDCVKKAIAVNKDKAMAEHLRQTLERYRVAPLPDPATVPAGR